MIKLYINNSRISICGTLGTPTLFLLCLGDSSSHIRTKSFLLVCTGGPSLLTIPLLISSYSPIDPDVSQPLSDKVRLTYRIRFQSFLLSPTIRSLCRTSSLSPTESNSNFSLRDHLLLFTL